MELMGGLWFSTRGNRCKKGSNDRKDYVGYHSEKPGNQKII